MQRMLDRSQVAWRAMMCITIPLGVVALDTLTKWGAQRALTLHEPVPVVGDLLQFTLAYNPGSAFGLFRGGGPWLVVLSATIMLAMMAWLGSQLLRGVFPPSAWAVLLILGGAAGNFVDRLPDGNVTDFLDCGIGSLRWPTFNLADSFITTAAVVLAWLHLATERASRTQTLGADSDGERLPERSQERI